MDEKQLALLLKQYLARAQHANVTIPCLEANNTSPVYSATTDNGVLTIRLDGPMDPWFGVSSSEIIAQMDDSDAETINLLINSPGGILTEGMSLYADLRARQNEGVTVNAEARGLVASAAILPFIAADTRTMGEGSMLMVHEPWGMVFAVGSAAEIKAKQIRC